MILKRIAIAELTVHNKYLFMRHIALHFSIFCDWKIQMRWHTPALKALNHKQQTKNSYADLNIVSLFVFVFADH